MEEEAKKILVTGGAGFIGSAVVRYLINTIGCFVLNVDKLTYAGNLNSLKNVISNPKYSFEKLDICDEQKLDRAVKDYKPNIIMHLAAESHVDRSIDGPSDFIQTNIVGTYNLLEVSRSFWSQLDENEKEQFRFHHVSTDEVFGSLGLHGAFTETTRYDPRSPYSASKASADHLVRAWHETFGLPVVLSNCSNNYGPYQFPEKLIPLMIMNASEGKSLPIYGDGSNIRDWLHVEDHCSGILSVLKKGRVGETYCIGGASEKTNMQVIDTLCEILDRKFPERAPHDQLKTFVKDRPGHDQRYAIDFSKIKNELEWAPSFSFEEGMEKTVDWYLRHQEWCENVTSGKYQRERLGTS